MTDTPEKRVEAVARAIANANGDEFANAFTNKTRWIAKRGMSGGRFRDCNEPFQWDYLDMARAAIAAMPKVEQQAARIAELEADKADLAEDTHRLREICGRKASETLADAIAAVEAERLCDPQNEEDAAYDRAIDDAIVAIRSLTPEPDTIGYVDDTGGAR